MVQLDPDSPLDVSGIWFKDNKGRILLLRGVNVSGNVKLPSGFSSFDPESKLFETDTITFVGRPFLESEADIHFQRLKHWGLLFLRFLVTWEAIEHKGPGIYDEEYIEYVCKILKIAQGYGFKCFIDPHQDVWSRFTGGSGAPKWTLSLVGLDITKFKHNDAAIVHNSWGGDSTAKHDFPKMIWPSNYNKYACQTMFTLFFGGNKFAPNLLIDRVNVQDYLQDHFINSMLKLVERIRFHKLNVVVGYETLNEPSGGYIGVEDLLSCPSSQILKYQNCPTPIQSMLLASGFCVENVEYWDRSMFGPKKVKTCTVNEVHESVWLPGFSCIWHHHGVWDIISSKTRESIPKEKFINAEGVFQAKFRIDSIPTTYKPSVWDIATAGFPLVDNKKYQVVIKNPCYFTHDADGNKYDFLQDFWLPFAVKYSKAIRSIDSSAIMFLEPSVNEYPPLLNGSVDGKIVYSPHWYDGLTLYNKSFAPFNVNVIGLLRKEATNSGFQDFMNKLNAVHIGESSISKAFGAQIATIKQEGLTRFGKIPCVFSETGIPFDLDDKASYDDHDYSSQIQALNATISAMEQNLVGFTLWNYSPNNDTEYGDFWNGEDFSVSCSTLDAEHVQNAVGENRMRRSSGFFGTLKDFLLPKKPYQQIGYLTELDKHGRALPALIRPYALKVCGTPKRMSFNLKERGFIFEFEADVSLPKNLATEIYVPYFHYGNEESKIVVYAPNGRYEWDFPNQLMLYYVNDGAKHHIIQISRAQEHHGSQL